MTAPNATTTNRTHAAITPAPGFVALGVAVVVGFQLQVVALWGSYYSHYPFPGYQNAIATMPPFFSESPRATLFMLIALGVVALGVVWLVREPLRALVALWCGAMIATAGWWVATPALRKDSDMWPIDLVFLGGYLAFPLVAIGVGAALLRRVGDAVRRQEPSS